MTKTSSRASCQPRDDQHSPHMADELALDDDTTTDNTPPQACTSSQPPNILAAPYMKPPFVRRREIELCRGYLRRIVWIWVYGVINNASVMRIPWYMYSAVLSWKLRVWWSPTSAIYAGELYQFRWRVYPYFICRRDEVRLSGIRRLGWGLLNHSTLEVPRMITIVQIHMRSADQGGEYLKCSLWHLHIPSSSYLSLRKMHMDSASSDLASSQF